MNRDDEIRSDLVSGLVLGSSGCSRYDFSGHNRIASKGDPVGLLNRIEADGDLVVMARVEGAEHFSLNGDVSVCKLHLHIGFAQIARSPENWALHLRECCLRWAHLRGFAPARPQPCHARN